MHRQQHASYLDIVLLPSVHEEMPLYLITIDGFRCQDLEEASTKKLEALLGF
jgi:hypothetical protein